jgi:hypothetical protein
MLQLRLWSGSGSSIDPVHTGSSCDVRQRADMADAAQPTGPYQHSDETEAPQPQHRLDLTRSAMSTVGSKSRDPFHPRHQQPG